MYLFLLTCVSLFGDKEGIVAVQMVVKMEALSQG